MTLLSRLWTVAVSAALVCCGHAPPPVYPALPPDPPKAPGFSAAARVVDITPPVHLALFGHGPESRVSTGVRLRLRCEVILVAAHGEVVALVPCDLQSSSEALQRAVADKLRFHGIPIAADRLFIMATHTHMAPAHYFEARRYSGVFSSILSGFDPMVVDHLATQISDGVRLAYADLAPACVAWQQASIADAQLQLNRAFVPYLSNAALYSGPSPDEVDPGFPRTIQRLQATDAPGKNVLGGELAVDPLLSLLRIDRRASSALVCDGAKPMAAFTVFGMHPTGLPNTNSLYHGDIFGYAMRVAEGKLTRRYFAGGIARPAAWDDDGAPPGQPENRRVIVGLANGSDGDVSPRIYEQSEKEARRVGRVLGGRIAALFESAPALLPDGKVDRLYRELNFSAARYGDSPDEVLCEHGELGTVTGGGARDGPTRLRVVPQTNQGFIPDVEDPCHRAKMPLRNGSPGEYDYPRVGAIALVRIGDGVIATAPGEMTTMTGLRIRRALTAALPQKTLALVGLTNQYFQYFTTQEEYPFQYYEGASTLYGPHSERFLNRQFGYLGMLLGQRWDPPLDRPHGPVVPQNDLPGQRAVNELRPFDRCHASPVIQRWPDDEPTVLTPSKELAVVPRFRYGAWGYEFQIGVLSPLSTTTLASEKGPELPECDAPFEATRSGKVGYRPLVVQVLESGVVIDDDMGPNLELQELDSEKWRVRWTPSVEMGDPRCGQRYSIRATLVKSAGAAPVVLEPPPFAIECRPPMPSGRAP